MSGSLSTRSVHFIHRLRLCWTNAISSVTLCKRIKRTESRHARWAMYGVRDSTDCYLANCSDPYRKQYGIDTVKTRGNDLQSALAVPDAVYNPVP